jgi:monoamine oxidase
MLRIPEGLRPAVRLQPPIDPRLQGAACSAKLKGIGRVAVVGGGLAGLMAARELVRQGIAVRLYEARPFIGGRVFSNRSFAKGRIIEEGAELIGSFHTRWLTLAHEFGLAMVSRMEPGLYKREGLAVQLVLAGRRLTPGEFDELNTAMEGRVLRPLAQLAKRLDHPSQPWLQAALFDGRKLWPLAMLDNMSVKDALPQFCQISRRGTNAADEPLWQMLDFKLVNDEVAPLDEMSFLSLLCKVRAGQGERMSKTLPANDDAYWDELEIFRCADGCDALATRLAAAIQTTQYGPQPAKVSRLVAVTRINISPLGVILGLKATNPDGSFKDDKLPIPSVVFSRVVFAVPPSVWERVQITVDKKAVDLAKEIGSLHMNDAVKHFSKVKERFWIKSQVAPHGGASQLGQVWEGTDNQTRLRWQYTVLSVFAGPVSDSKRAPKRDDIEKIGLPNLFPGTVGNPGYASNLIKPTLFSDWPNTAFIKAGYWAPLPGEIFKVSKKLTEPLFNGRLFFAGEHTDTGFFGYMEGALRSGERAANTLMLGACGLWKADAPEPLRVAEAAGEARPRRGPDEESSDETVPDEHEAIPVWDEAQEGWSGEDELGESFEDEDMPLAGAEVNTESAAEADDEHVDAAAFD